jgi:hypothetical protein
MPVSFKGYVFGPLSKSFNRDPLTLHPAYRQAGKLAS